jgi:hypothetical protein
LKTLGAFSDRRSEFFWGLSLSSGRKPLPASWMASCMAAPFRLTRRTVAMPCAMMMVPAARTPRFRRPSELLRCASRHALPGSRGKRQPAIRDQCFRRRQLERQHRLQRPHSTLEVSDSRQSRRPIFSAKQGIFESRLFLSRMLETNSLEMAAVSAGLQSSGNLGRATRNVIMNHPASGRKARSRNALTYHGLVGSVSANVGVVCDPSTTYLSVI